MTTRRLNYTGCKRIRRADIAIRVESADSAHRLACAFDFEGYDFPQSAAVVVEAQAHWTLMRFDFGTVASPSTGAFALSEFTTVDGILFRVKVIGVGEKAGLILGEADGVRPAEDNALQDARSFLAVQPAELGHVTWRLSLAGTEPLLQINRQISDWRSFLRRQEVRSLVLPEVYRQLLLEALTNPADAESEDDWRTAILSTVSAGAGPRPAHEDDADCAAWADIATTMFAAKHRLFRGVEQWNGGVE